MTQGILLSSGVTDSFMIKGVFKYTVFGQEVWITTTHICMLIVMLIMMVFALCANRAMKHASEVPTGLQNVVELIVEKLDGMIGGTMGKHAGHSGIISEQSLSLSCFPIYRVFLGCVRRLRIMA